MRTILQSRMPLKKMMGGFKMIVSAFANDLFNIVLY